VARGAATDGVTWLAPGLFLVLTALRLALIMDLGLFNDEAYYWEWSRHLGLSYYDHPPAVAYVLAASTWLLGRSQFAVHFPALILSILTSGVLYRLTLDLFPGRRQLAWWSVVLLNVSPLFGLGAVFTTPDAPVTLCWALATWLTWRAVHGDPRLWYVAGIVSGLGMLSKYTFFLFPPAVLAFLLTSRHRSWLRTPAPYLALAIAFSIFSPVVIWNFRHGWASFTFQLWDRHVGPFQPWVYVARFVAAQQTLTPLLWIACLWGLLRSYRLGRAGSDAHWYLFWVSAVMYGFFAIVSLFTLVNPNWFGMAFLTMLVSAADALSSSRSWTWRVAPGALAALVTLAFYLQASTLIVPIPPRIDFATDLNGWSEVGNRLREIRAGMPDPTNTFVFSHRFQGSALAAFYGGDDLEVTRLGPGRDQYSEWTRVERLVGRDAIYFADGLWFRPPPVGSFRSCVPAGELPIVRSGRKVRTFLFWRCLGYRG
jgi:undecaprenyl-diphosphatase